MNTDDPQLKTYLWVYIALMVLLLLTVGSTQLSLGAFKPVVNMGIAIMKTVLIMVFFMQLRHGSGTIRLFALGGFFWLGILMVLTLSDYLTRDPG